MRKVFLASHGGLAVGAKTSIEMIIGEQEHLKAYSLQPGGSAADFAAEIEQEILAEPENEFIILTDLYGASVCNAMMPLGAHENAKVFSGLNLGLALEVLTAEPEPFTEEAVDKMVANVRMGVQQVKMEAVEEEDFKMEKNILSVFNEVKPIIGVIHCKGENDEDMLRRAKEEIRIYEENGVSGVLVETYFGTYHQVEMVLSYLQNRSPKIPYGVNCLNVDAMGFILAEKYGCDYLQIDSVGGHLKARDDESLEAFFNYFRKDCHAYLMGGVRFKYQPILSGRTTEEDLKICMDRCDAICVTENATGEETSIAKIQQFRDTIGDFPLIVCAGMTTDNVKEQLKVADAGVVGSYFKDTYKDTGDVSAEHVKTFMEQVRELRKELAND